jgi:uncharacterized protein
VVIETDGRYEQVDSLKASFDGAPETGTNIFGDSLDSVACIRASTPASRVPAGCARPASSAPSWPAAAAGSSAPLPDRKRFDNPSVYCTDLLALISYISSRLPGQGRR